jgi:hypothetical protein
LVTVPVVSGIVDVSVLRRFQSDASLVDGSIAALALPPRPIGRFHKIAILRYIHGHARLIDVPIPAIAFPSTAVGRVHQIPVRGYLDGGAGLVDFPITSIALPSIAGRVEKSIRRHLDGCTNPANLSKSMITLPTTSVGHICWVCVGRHLDGHASLVDGSIPSIALPSAPIAPRV